MLESDLITRAQGGDSVALDDLLLAAKDKVYRVALRMLGNPTDAEDATQEILMRVVNGLGSFRGESAFGTWVYRIASNYLLRARKHKAEEQFEGFDALGAFLDAGLADSAPAIDDQVLVTEAMLKCTSAMLLCLDRDHRMAFILGEILELTSDEGAAVLGVTSETFRKRLSRARERMAESMERRCGLFNESLPCRCAKQAGRAVAHGMLSPSSAVFATHAARAKDTAEANARLDDIDRLRRAATVQRVHPDYVAPAPMVERVREALRMTKSGLV